MFIKRCTSIITLLSFLTVGLFSSFVLETTPVHASSNHPQVYTKDTEKSGILSKINNNQWAEDAYDNILNEIDTYVTQHQTDPDWITSRLAMYWKAGEHYTQCYIKDQNWDYGIGNAPIPTVRMPGMRTWNEYKLVSLADRTPYNETGDMWAKDGLGNVVLVPYKQTGHLIRENNAEILELAEKAAFVYWLNGDSKYADFSADILWTWLLGTYYMQPALDPQESLRGPGGYLPGGISGYYDYEVIHDDRAPIVAATYDFLYDYLAANLHPHLTVIGKGLKEVAGEVFKRFIDINLVRAEPDGNWNVNAWKHIMPQILALETNSFYADGKGREYYVNLYTTTGTVVNGVGRGPLPYILQQYDTDTGLWPESPGYAFSIINSLIEIAMPLYNNGYDTIGDEPLFEKAANAVFPWMDERGNLISFGDGRGGPATFTTFEKLYTYYTSMQPDLQKATDVSRGIAAGVDNGIYNRADEGMMGLIYNKEVVQQASSSETARSAYSEFHKHITMKNPTDNGYGLMATLYGGTSGSHLHENGLAIQLYGGGWAYGPKSSYYESYWSGKDYLYSKGRTGSNTILPGYSAGPITVNAIDPAVDNSYTNDKVVSTNVNFSDVSASEKRRLLGIIRTSPTTGYYVDVFRSDQNNNDYLYHNLGNQLDIVDAAGNPISLTSTNDLGTAYDSTYSLFMNQEKVSYSGDFTASWTLPTTPNTKMDMWMKGQSGRQIYIVDAPPTTVIDTVTPLQMNNIEDGMTPAIIVRQNNNNAWNAPFIGVFEPYDLGGLGKSIESITDMSSSANFVGLKIESKPLTTELIGRVDYIVNALDDNTYNPTAGLFFRGTFGVASENAQGFKSLYLGKGEFIEKDGYRMDKLISTQASNLENVDGTIQYSSYDSVGLSIPYTNSNPLIAFEDLRLYYKNTSGVFVEAQGYADEAAGLVTGVLPEGYGVELMIGEGTMAPFYWATQVVDYYSKFDFPSATHNLGTNNVDEVEITFDITPKANNIDVAVGYADTSTIFGKYDHMNMVVRLNNSGSFDVRNGLTYTSLTSVPYSANNTYSIRVVTDSATRKYSVWVTPSGSAEIQIADNYDYRTNSPYIDEVGQICFKENGTSNSASISNHDVHPYVNQPVGSVYYSEPVFADAIHDLGTGNNGDIEITFDMVPLGNNIDVVAGYGDSATNIGSYTDMNMIVRLNTSGFFDVRNGLAYAALNSVPYSANNTYSLRITSTVSSRKYSVWVTPSGGSEIQIANNYDYRTGAPLIDDIGKLCVKENTTSHSAYIQDHDIHPQSY